MTIESATDKGFESKCCKQDLWFWCGLFLTIFPWFALFLKNPPLCDWLNHTWMINYGARFFLAHGSFVSVFNTFEYAGLPYPIFYGYLFFKLMALASLFFDANFTLRVCVLLVAIAQFCLLYHVILSEGGNRKFALFICLLVAWAVYPLTAVYIRSAIPEYVACGLVTIACLGIIKAASAASQLRFWLWCNASVLCMTLAAGTHPITGVYGGCSFVSVFLLAMLLHSHKPRYKLAVGLIPPAIIGIICLSPWVVSTGEFRKDLVITRDFDRVFYSPLIDKFSCRLMPIPTRFCKLPVRLLEHKQVVLPPDEDPVSALDAPINVPLAIVFLLIALRVCRDAKPRLKFALIFTGIAASCLVVLSCVPKSIEHLGEIARSVQFAYRLVSFVNLAMLVGVIFCLSSRETVSEWQSGNRYLLGALIALAAVAMLFRLSIMWKCSTIEPVLFSNQRKEVELLHMPVKFYGMTDYGTPRLFVTHSAAGPAFDRMIWLKPAGGAQFGDIPPVKASIAEQKRSWLATNVLAFPWNHVLEDNRELSSDQERVALTSPFHSYLHPYADSLSVDFGGSTLAYRFAPSRLWHLLSQIGPPTFFIWTAITFISGLFFWRKLD